MQAGITYPSRDEMVQYIRQVAVANGIDPDIAVRVAASEGLNADPRDGWQSNVMQNGRRERSYGPYQLYVGGGLGNEFIDETGLDPSDPSTWREQVDFALGEARTTGWSPWYGAARVGISDSEGLGGAPRPQAALGDDRGAGIEPEPEEDEEPSAFQQWYSRTDDKLRSTLGLPDRPADTEDRRQRMATSNMLVQNGLRMMNGGFY